MTPLEQIKDEVNRRLEAGAVVIQNEWKAVASVPAPRVRVLSRKGFAYYRATTKAAQGAPLRKLSGTYRQRITRAMDRANLAGRVGTNIVYARRGEKHHPTLAVALERCKGRLEQVLGANITATVGTGK